MDGDEGKKPKKRNRSEQAKGSSSGEGVYFKRCSLCTCIYGLELCMTSLGVEQWQRKSER